jgi:hypothetical protein
MGTASKSANVGRMSQECGSLSDGIEQGDRFVSQPDVLQWCEEGE